MPFIDSVSSDAEVGAEGTRLCGEQVYCSNQTNGSTGIVRRGHWPNLGISCPVQRHTTTFCHLSLGYALHLQA